MSTATAGPRVPDLTLGWRLKMALGEHKAEWIADQLGGAPDSEPLDV